LIVSHEASVLTEVSTEPEHTPLSLNREALSGIPSPVTVEPITTEDSLQTHSPITEEASSPHAQVVPSTATSKESLHPETSDSDTFGMVSDLTETTTQEVAVVPEDPKEEPASPDTTDLIQDANPSEHLTPDTETPSVELSHTEPVLVTEEPLTLMAPHTEDLPSEKTDESSSTLNLLAPEHPSVTLQTEAPSTITTETPSKEPLTLQPSTVSELSEIPEAVSEPPSMLEVQPKAPSDEIPDSTKQTIAQPSDEHPDTQKPSAKVITLAERKPSASTSLDTSKAEDTPSAPAKAKVLSGLFEDVPLVKKVSSDTCPPPTNLIERDAKLWVSLVENELVDITQLKALVDENKQLKLPNTLQQTQGLQGKYVPLQKILSHYQLVTEAQLCEGLRTVYRGRFIEPGQVSCTMAAVFQVPIDFIESREVVPLTYDAKRQRLEILLENPQDSNLLDELAQVTRVRVAARVTTDEKHQTLLNEAYQLAVLEFASGMDGMIDNYDFLGRTSDTSAGFTPSHGTSATQKTDGSQKNVYGLPFSLDGDSEHHATQLVDHFLKEAYLKHASDIHFEVHGDGLMVRYRIDGLLKDILLLPTTIGLNVISRIKVLTSLDISQKRLPQDGGNQLTLQLDERMTQSVEIRVNTLPTRLGESVCVRVLKPHQVDGMLESLLMSSEMLARLKRLLQMPQGMILVTGPTGSGKTSTLYTCLNSLNHRTRKICTIEDPVEYQLPGICQTQVSVKSGLSFDKSLRAMLRHDPDILMVGEIRDNETLEVAMHAAATGHLVLTTLHTNSAMNTISRMKELNASPQLLTNTLAGIIAQRLVRKVCTHCAEDVTPDEHLLELLGMHRFASESTPSPTFKKAVGCSVCYDTGYAGRLAVFEMLMLNRELARGIEEGVSMIQLEDIALSHQLLQPLRQDAYEKAAQGLTTIEELLRVLGPAALNS
ncbi:MAG: ATPase, T2SS/T4P/T4SS family, partial [Vampirovibrionales bacterium]